MKRSLFAFLFLLFGVSFALAQSTQQLCYTTNGANCIPAVAASKNKVIAVSSATTTELVALVASQNIYVTSWDVVSSAAGTLKLVYGTGTACGTGTTDLTGTYTLATSTVFTKGNGVGSILTVPPGNALCITSGGSVAAQGSLSYAQF